MYKLLPILFAVSTASPLIYENYQSPLIADDWYITQYRVSSNELRTFHADGDLFGIDDLENLEGGYVFACYVTYNDVSDNFAYLELEYYINFEYLNRFEFIAVEILFGPVINDEIYASSIGSFTYSNSMYLNNTIGLSMSSFQTDEANQNWDFYTAQYDDYNLVSAESYDIQQGDFFFSVALGQYYYNLGYSEGEENGYNQGVLDGQKDGFGIEPFFRSIFNVIDSIGQIEIFPNIKLYFILGIPIIFGVLAFVLNLFRW